MKVIDTDGISYIERVQGATDEWYYGISYEHGDLYEAEEIFEKGHPIEGRQLCLVHYPDGAVFVPVPKKEGCYCEKPVFYEESIYILNVEFTGGLIQIIRFCCADHSSGIYAELPLSSVKDCYNLSLQIAPLTLSRQRVGTNEFEIIWPERIGFNMDDHDSFFLRKGDRLFFSRWHEEGEGEDYRYWEETIIRDTEGNIIETLPGDVMLMPNGDMWHLRTVKSDPAGI